MDRTRILLVEDDAEDALLVERRLPGTERPGSFSLERAAGLQEGLDKLGKKNFDALLLDLQLPDSQGIDTVLRVRDAHPRLPIVVFTARGDRETSVGALRAGAQDYLMKDELMTGELIDRSIRYAIERCKMAEQNEQLQARLRDQEKTESLRGLAAGLAVAFNNVLGDILDRTDHAMGSLTEAGRSREMRRDLAEVRRQALRAANMASQLRSYAATAVQPESALSLSEFAMQMSELLESLVPQQIELQLDLEGSLPQVRADALQCRELLINLVLNASEAIGKAPGSIRVSTGSTWVDRALLERSHADPGISEGPYAFLRVSDTGPPITAETEARMFDPFFSTKYAGRGLGLAAAFGIARRHRGAILVESAVDQGSSLTIFFPASATRSKLPAEGQRPRRKRA